MAAVDSLVRLIAGQNADGLRLVTGQVPKLVKAGFTQALSMPPVGAAMMEVFVGEVLTPAQLEEAAQPGGVTVDYGELTATVRRQGDGWELAFKRRPARARPAAPAAAAPVAPAAPASVAAAPPPPPPSPAPVDELAGSVLDRWLARAQADRASDLLVSAERGARLRVDGDLVALPGGSLTSEQILAVFGPALAEHHRAALAAHGSADLAWVWHSPDGENVRFRVNLFRQASGLAVAFRPIGRAAPTLSELGLPAALERLVGFPHGLVLVTGPTGSGKSTTLVALVEHLAATAARHIITLEDPIEYEYAPGRSLVHQRELGTHVDSFEHGLRAALRESPDVILLGEMRDRATIAAALTAAETGHLVLATLHAGGAAMAIERIVDVFPEHQQRNVRAQLAGALRVVLTQLLLPATRPGVRLPVVELLIVTPAAGTLIRDAKTHQLASVIQTGRDDGMIPLERSLADRVDAGDLAVETALAVTLDGGEQLRQLLAPGRPKRR
jgi:twitching motility protein PilT